VPPAGRIVIFWCHVARLVLYSDMPIVADGLRAVIQDPGGFELVSVCATLPELHQAVSLTEPHIVVLDFTAEFSPRVLRELAALLLARKVVLLVYEITRDMALHAISLGIRGILRSTLSTEMVLRCLQQVHQGERWFEKAMLEDPMPARRAELTGRETQLVRLLGLGLKNREIAETLDITEGTVKVYLSRLFQKLGVNDRFELALYGMKNPAAGTVRLPRVPSVRRGPRRSSRLLDGD
jgi:two-component system, NarL family, nitrate/nitrite response regulator NarL